MRRHPDTRPLRRGIALLVVAAACGSDAARSDSAGGAGGAGGATADGNSATSSSAGQSSTAEAASDAPADLTPDLLDAYARGIARETELVRAAQARASSATTPEARGEAMQAQWEDRTAPEGARSAGLEPARYRRVRRTVHDVLSTLDFQGKIDGPMQLDTARATPEMRRRLAGDAFADLTPASKTALQARMDRLVPLWVEYVRLTAVGG